MKDDRLAEAESLAEHLCASNMFYHGRWPDRQALLTEVFSALATADPHAFPGYVKNARAVIDRVSKKYATSNQRQP